MSRLFTSAIYVLAGIVMPSCSLFEEPAHRPVLLPLVEGNRWTYTVIVKGNPSEAAVFRVVDVIPVGRFQYSEIEIERTSFSTGEVTIDKMYAYNEEGLWLYDSTRGDRRVIGYYRYPITPGDFYFNTDNKRICTAEAEGMAMPAGTFDVLIYGECDNFDATRMILTPDVGIIFWGDFAGTSYHLIDYEVK